MRSGGFPDVLVLVCDCSRKVGQKNFRLARGVNDDRGERGLGIVGSESFCEPRHLD